ncbi:uncharacterized protein [Montipora capricornis]|uniref:uncharacterized protein isoform X2 n=1 Tax=Montipora capricornis TaxID=246305 RepID=UPI0035F10549
MIVLANDYSWRLFLIKLEFPIAGRRDLKGLLTSILQGTTIWCLTPCLCPAPQVGVRMNIQSISYQRIVEIQCTSNKRTFLSC